MIPPETSGFLEYAAQCASAGNLPGKSCEEPSFTAYIAERNGVPVYTGEPSAPAVLSFFKSHGFSIQDFFALWILSNIPQEKRHGDLTSDKFVQLVDRVVRNQNQLLNTSIRFTSHDFAAAYRKNMPTPRNYLDITQEDTSPGPPLTGPDTVLHALAGLSNPVRDRNVVVTIQTVLRNNNRLLVVCGASHLDFEWARTRPHAWRAPTQPTVLTALSLFGSGQPHSVRE